MMKYLNIFEKNNQNNNPHVQELYQTTMKKFKGTWISTPEATQLYVFLAQLVSAKKILEIGTFMGYATLQLALATTDDTTIYTCEAKKSGLLWLGHIGTKQEYLIKLSACLGWRKQAYKNYNQNIATASI